MLFATVERVLNAGAAMSRCLCLFLICAGAPHLAHALSANKSIDHFVTDTWRTGDGLPELAIEALLETSDGYLWVGTQEGLARFDGEHFSVFDHVNTPPLRSDFILMLAEDAQHTLWIGSESGLVMRSVDGTFRSFTEKDGLHVTRVACGMSDVDGSVWVGGTGGIAHIVEGRVVESFDARDELDRVTDIASDHAGSIWIVARGHLNRLRDGKIEHFSIADGLSENVTRVIIDKNHQPQILTNTPTIFRLSQGRFEQGSPQGIPKSERIRTIHEDRDGTIWYLSDTQGLFRTRKFPNGGQFTEKGFGDIRLELLYEDRAGNIWLGSLGRGLIRLHDGSFNTLTKRDGLVGDGALSVLVEKSGTAWIGTASGLTRLNADAVSQFSTADGLPSNHVSSLASDHSDGLWIGMRGNAVSHLRKGKIDRTLVLKLPLVGNVVSAVFQDSQGRLWMGTTGAGLVLNTGDALHYFTNGDAQAENYINAIMEDSRGDVWIGTNNGIWNVHDGKIDTHPLNDAAARWTITSIYEDPQNRLWVGTMAGGLKKVQGGVISEYGREKGLPDTINNILSDDGGNLWLGSNRGIVRIPSDQIEDIVAGRRDRFEATLFGEADGMRIAETISGNQPTSWRADDGRLWFVTGEGVGVVDPKRIERNTRPLKPIIESLRADDKSIDLAHADFKLPAKTSRLEIRFTAPDLVSANAMQFRYRLSNYDDTWSYVGNERVARYVNVPPGTHRFELQARRDYEDWSAAAAGVDFYVTPMFHQTPWFYAALAFAALAILWLLHHLRIQWLRMESAVADERRRLAGEIHDSLAQGFTAISVQIEAALGRLARAPDMAISHLRLARDVAGTSLAEARRSVWNLQTTTSSVSSLLTSIRSTCEQVVFGYRTVLAINAVGKPWIANPSIEQNVVRIVQEAVANAVHHGEANEVQVNVAYKLTHLILTITDDGRGFEVGKCQSTANRGFGMKSMLGRTESLHGRMDIQSVAGVGTRIELTIPRSNLLRHLPGMFTTTGSRHDAAA
jgi:signal transduction histidine kinase/ligand-binding sensor domain-containing protein